MLLNIALCVFQDIQRFFAPSKPAAPKPSNASSTDEEQKKKPKSTSKVEQQCLK